MITHNISKILSNVGPIDILEILYSKQGTVTLLNILKITTKISRTTIMSHIKIMIKAGLIEKIFSKYNVQTLGYRITNKGCKCFEIYLSLLMRLQS